MAAAKTERLLNLVIALLSTRRALPRAVVRERVAAYREAPTEEAFERMFERDKDELRELGIPVLTEDLDVYFSDEPAYRIDRGEYALPDLEVTPEQMSLLALAGRTWSEASLGGAAARALRKLEAVAPEEDSGGGVADGLDRIEAGVRTSDPAFEAVRTAVVTTRPVRFDYRGRRGDVTRRRVQPWGITAWHGHWYLTGLDVDREEPRVFRLDRIVGRVSLTGAPGSYDIPEDHDPRAVVASSLAGGEKVTATLRIRPGRGFVLRRGARVLEASSTSAPASTTAPASPASTTATTPTETDPAGWDVVEVVGAGVSSLADEILGHGADVRVESPPELGELVVERLRAVVAAHEDGGAA